MLKVNWKLPSLTMGREFFRSRIQVSGGQFMREADEMHWTHTLSVEHPEVYLPFLEKIDDRADAEASTLVKLSERAGSRAWFGPSGRPLRHRTPQQPAGATQIRCDRN